MNIKMNHKMWTRLCFEFRIDNYIKAQYVVIIIQNIFNAYKYNKFNSIIRSFYIANIILKKCRNIELDSQFCII